MTLGDSKRPLSPIFLGTFEEYLNGGEEFKLRPFKKEDGRMAIALESEDGESAEFDVYNNIALSKK